MKLQTMLIGLTFAVPALWASTAVAAQQPALNPTAPDIRQTDPRASGPLTTDTVGGNGHPAAAKGYRIVTDTLGGNGHPAAANSYRVVTDTLGGKGGADTTLRKVIPSTPRVGEGSSPGLSRERLATGQVVTLPNGFDWADAAVGAAFVAGLAAIALAAWMLVRRRYGLPQLNV